MKRPQEHEFSSFTAYARALEDYCTSIEQPEPEPVAWINWSALTGKPRLGWECESELASEPLYKSPPKREWQGLTEEEIEAMGLCAATKADIQDIEGKLKEKNT